MTKESAVIGLITGHSYNAGVFLPQLSNCKRYLMFKTLLITLGVFFALPTLASSKHSMKLESNCIDGTHARQWLILHNMTLLFVSVAGNDNIRSEIWGEVVDGVHKKADIDGDKLPISDFKQIAILRYKIDKIDSVECINVLDRYVNVDMGPAKELFGGEK